MNFWSLAGKQCASKTNRNLKTNETKKMGFFPLSKPKTGNLHCHKGSAGGSQAGNKNVCPPVNWMIFIVE